MPEDLANVEVRLKRTPIASELSVTNYCTSVTTSVAKIPGCNDLGDSWCQTVQWDLLDCISHNDPIGLAGPLNGCWEAFKYDNKVWLLVAWSSEIQHSIMLCTRTKSLVCPALEGPSVRGWWKKIKDGWSSYLEKRKEAGEKGRMMSVWSRDTPPQGIYILTPSMRLGSEIWASHWAYGMTWYQCYWLGWASFFLALITVRCRSPHNRALGLSYWPRCQ